jgi:hypothetical protein
MARFVDAQAMHRKHPTTFEVPSAKQLTELKVGDFVKINANHERFWVKLTRVNGKKLEGVVDNKLIQRGLKLGQKVRFETKHIYSVMAKRKSLLGGLFSNRSTRSIVESNPLRQRVKQLMR